MTQHPNPKPPQYDPHIVPAEVAAREDREKEQFGHTPHESAAAQADPEALDTTTGYTVDQEGLVNNYAVEPEMYINEPGDLREQEAALAAERQKVKAELAEGEEGKLSIDHDDRHKGPGLI